MISNSEKFSKLPKSNRSLYLYIRDTCGVGKLRVRNGDSARIELKLKKEYKNEEEKLRGEENVFGVLGVKIGEARPRLKGVLREFYEKESKLRRLGEEKLVEDKSTETEGGERAKNESRGSFEGYLGAREHRNQSENDESTKIINKNKESFLGDNIYMTKMCSGKTFILKENIKNDFFIKYNKDFKINEKNNKLKKKKNDENNLKIINNEILNKKKEEENIDKDFNETKIKNLYFKDTFLEKENNFTETFKNFKQNIQEFKEFNNELKKDFKKETIFQEENKTFKNIIEFIPLELDLTKEKNQIMEEYENNSEVNEYYKVYDIENSSRNEDWIENLEKIDHNSNEINEISNFKIYKENVYEKEINDQFYFKDDSSLLSEENNTEMFNEDIHSLNEENKTKIEYVNPFNDEFSKILFDQNKMLNETLSSVEIKENEELNDNILTNEYLFKENDKILQKVLDEVSLQGECFIKEWNDQFKVKDDFHSLLLEENNREILNKDIYSLNEKNGTKLEYLNPFTVDFSKVLNEKTKFNQILLVQNKMLSEILSNVSPELDSKEAIVKENEELNDNILNNECLYKKNDKILQKVLDEVNLQGECDLKEWNDQFYLEDDHPLLLEDKTKEILNKDIYSLNGERETKLEYLNPFTDDFSKVLHEKTKFNQILLFQNKMLSEILSNVSPELDSKEVIVKENEELNDNVLNNESFFQENDKFLQRVLDEVSLQGECDLKESNDHTSLDDESYVELSENRSVNTDENYDILNKADNSAENFQNDTFNYSSSKLQYINYLYDIDVEESLDSYKPESNIMHLKDILNNIDDSTDWNDLDHEYLRYLENYNSPTERFYIRQTSTIIEENSNLTISEISSSLTSDK